jgi:hypothetical protein
VKSAETAPVRERKLSSVSARSVASRISNYVSVVKDTVSEKIPGYKESLQKDYQCCEQPHLKACFWGLTVPLVNNFTRGAIVKFLLELAIKRSFVKLYKHSKSEILRFGITIGLTATTFHAAMCLLRRIGKA